MSSMDAFVGRSWEDWSNAIDQNSGKIKADKRQDQIREKALEVVRQETPRLQIDRDIVVSQVCSALYIVPPFLVQCTN